MIHIVRRKSGVRALTFIEILVVMTVVAGLIALALPAYTHVREKVRRTQCLNNLHQLSMAQFAYAGDHEGWFWGPNISAGTQGGGNSPVGYYEDNNLSNYVHKSEILYCPSRLRREMITPGPFNGNTIQPWGQTQNSHTHYGIVRFMMMGDDPKYILMHERAFYQGASFGWTDLYPPNTTSLALSDAANHGTEGSNILYVDGRVEWKKGDIGPFYGTDKWVPDWAPADQGVPRLYYSW